jgi:hypothetical protein
VGGDALAIGFAVLGDVAAGVTVFTIGLGSELERDALRSMASRPRDFYEAPDGEDLAAIYAQIAVEIPCPPSRWWGRR